MSNLPSLLQISHDLSALLEKIESQDGVVTLQDEEALSSVMIQSAEKVSNYCVVLDRFENEKEYVKKQIAALKEYYERLDNRQKSLERIALEVVKAHGILEGTCGRKISKRASTKVIIDDKEQIPPFYQKIKVDVDAALVKQALKDGKRVPGAHLEDNLTLSWK